MNLFIKLTLLFLLPFSMLGQNPNPSAELDEFILGEMDYENIPGMSTLIVKGGEIVWVESYGMADIENNTAVSNNTSFLMASVSKLFTGTALMQLQEEGLVDLDQDINTYLPFSVNNPNFPNEMITPRMLMTHTSSITDNGSAMDGYYSTGDPTITLADCMEMYFSLSGADYSASNNFTNNSPGTDFDYSNMATALAGYLVEVVSQQQFNEYSDLNIFDALCMDNTSWFLSGLDTLNIARPYNFQGGLYSPIAHYGFADYPNGLLRSSVLDLANFMLAYLQGGAFNDNQLLGSSFVNEMLAPQIPFIDDTQGLNWYTEEIYLSGGGVVDMWGHNGGESGATTDLYINPENGIGIVVLSNAEGENLYVVDELYDYALSLSTSGVGNPSCDPLSVDYDAQSALSLSVYPNPANNSITIQSDRGGVLSIESVLGVQTIKQDVKSTDKVDVSSLSVGIYFVVLNDEILKLVIQ
jgi:CubicO group peptidase (beta-lactamase class C family)